MRVHYLQHVGFEGLGSMEPYFRAGGHQLTATHLYWGEALPSVDDLDWLIVMGGPMGVHDLDRYPWLAQETAFLQQAIAKKKIVLGICLGAQLIADVLGAVVEKNAHREIGWFPIEPAPEAAAGLLGDVIPASLEVFHWHGDRFHLPPGAQPLASSEACADQGFVFDRRVVGFQFHLETTLESARALIDNSRDGLDGSRYVQGEAQMLSDQGRFERINQVMTDVLRTLEAAGG